jgi:hypothetical protein
MKLSGFVIALLFVSFVFLTMGIIITDIEKSYPNSYDVDYVDEESISDLSDRYNFRDSIVGNVTDLKKRFENFNDAEGAWETFKGLLGMIPIPFVILLVPVKVLLMVVTNGYLLVEDMGRIIGVPILVINMGLGVLLVIVIFKLVSWWHTKEKI